MSNLVSEIKTAIDSFDMERARELLREALKQNPSADVYYLASLAAVNEQQKKSFLEKAIELDPFHKDASNELQKNKKPSSAIRQSQPPQPRQVKVETQISAGNQAKPNFSMGNALVIAAIGSGVASFFYSLKWVLLIPYTTGTNSTWFDWFAYPLASFIGGMTIAFALGQLMPSIKSSGIQIAFGFVIGSVLDLAIGHPIYYAIYDDANGFIRVLIWNFFNIVAASIVMSVVTEKIIKGIGGKIFGYWLIANALQNIFYLITPDFNLFEYPIQIIPYTASNIIGGVIFGVVGCYLTLNEMRKSLPNSISSI